MRRQYCILGLPVVSATNLYVAGKNLITTLRLDLGSEASTLTTNTTHSGCAADPSCLFLDHPAGQLYCVDDDTTNNRSVSTYQTSPSGALTVVQRTSTSIDPVSGTLYYNDTHRTILVANFHPPDLGSDVFGLFKFDKGLHNLTDRGT